MAREIQLPGPTGATLYAVLLDASGANLGKAWNGAAFEVPASANWATYAVLLAEQGATGLYEADMPAIPGALYTVTVYRRAGGSPAVGDAVVGLGSIDWTGTAVATVNGPVRANVVQVNGTAASAGGVMDARLVDATATGLAKFFTVNSGKTYLDAVVGSPVYETAANAAGGGGGGGGGGIITGFAAGVLQDMVDAVAGANPDDYSADPNSWIQRSIFASAGGGGGGATAAEVWTYGNRTLTGFGFPVVLADGAITSAKFTVAGYTGPAAGIVERIDQVWRYFFKHKAKQAANATAGQVVTFRDNGQVQTTQAYTVNGNNEDLGSAT